MSKGKYAARAALRREDQDVSSEIGGYQHHVRRLTAENKELSDRLAALQSQFRDETRRLRAERDEGMSPEVSALRKELAAQREMADLAARENGENVKRLHRLSVLMQQTLHEQTGCTRREAVEVVRAVGEDDELRMHLDSSTGAGQASLSGRSRTDPEAIQRVETIQRSRGFRSGPDVSERLRDIVEAARQETSE